MAWRAPRHAVCFQSGVSAFSKHSAAADSAEAAQVLPSQREAFQKPERHGDGRPEQAGWAVCREGLLLMRILSCLGEYRIHTSGTGILRCASAAQGKAHLQASLAGFHLVLRPSPLPLQTSTALFPGERRSTWCVCLYLLLVPRLQKTVLLPNGFCFASLAQ